MIKNHKDESSPLIPETINSYRGLVGYVEEKSRLYENQPLSRLSLSVITVIPLIFGVVVASTQSLIDIVLTSEFFTEKLEFHNILSIVLASIFAIPNLFVSFLSSR